MRDEDSEHKEDCAEEPEKAKPERKLPPFDPSSSPYSPNNVPAARARGLRFRRGYYRDADGEKVLDRFGQPLG